MKTSGDNANTAIAKRNHKYMPLANQAKAGSSTHDPSNNMMISQTSSNF